MLDIVNSKKPVHQKIQEKMLAPFREIIPDAEIERWTAEAGGRLNKRHFTAVTILWTCVWKQLKNTSTTAVERLMAVFGSIPIGNGEDFCKARLKLPLPVFEDGLRATAQHMQDNPAEHWAGFKIARIDGTTTTANRSLQNLQRFGCSQNQTSSSKFPIIRITFLVVLGAIRALAAGPYNVSELAQAISLLGCLPDKTILLADGLYGSFLNIALLSMQGHHFVSPKHANRKGKRLRRLGRGDWIERITRPRPEHCHRPDLLAALPEYLDIRIIRCAVHRDGFRDFTIHLCTTLCGPKLYPAEGICELYKKRWSIELDIRTLKGQHGLDHLQCNNPEAALREIYSACMAFNCARVLMSQTGLPVSALSHKAAVDLILEAGTQMACASATALPGAYRALIGLIGQCKLDQRKRLSQPRVIARVTRRFPSMTFSRRQWRAWHRPRKKSA